MAAPLGNSNAVKKNRLLTDALRRELTQNPEDARKITRKLIDCAIAGEAWAQQMVHDRLEGKPAQSLTLSGDEDNPLRNHHIVEFIDGADSDPKET